MWEHGGDRYGNNISRGMTDANVRSCGNYQAEVTGAQGELALSTVMKSLTNEFHVIDNVLLDINRTREIERIRAGKKKVSNKHKVINQGTGEIIRETSQIDHIMVSPYGIYVVETKNYKGMMFGDPYGKVWTQVLRGMHNTVYNPVAQNEGHMRHLSQQISVKREKMMGVIVFTNPSVDLRNVMCQSLYTLEGFYELINRNRNIIFTDRQVEEIINRIDKVNIAGYKNNIEHVEYVKSVQSKVRRCMSKRI